MSEIKFLSFIRVKEMTGQFLILFLETAVSIALVREERDAIINSSGVSFSQRAVSILLCSFCS